MMQCQFFLPTKYRSNATIIYMKADEAKERIMLTSFLEVANTFYKNPINQQAYETWKNNKEAKHYANHIKPGADT